MSQLTAAFVELTCEGSEWWPELNGRVLEAAWRVEFPIADRCCALPMAFARRRDAELAKSALEREGIRDWETIHAAGRERVERIMIEAMQW